jgi:hypothetical protein
MRAIVSFCLIGWGVILTAAGAVTPQDGTTIGQDIPVEEWRAMAMGRTLTYRIDGAIWALEYYYPGTNRVTLQSTGGECMQGTWEYVAPLYCFNWDIEGTSCFRHLRLGNEIVIVVMQDGIETGSLQTMTGASDVPLYCGPAVTS